MPHHIASLRRLAFLLVLFGMALGAEYHPRAQGDPDRVSVNLIQEPNWQREVWPADFNRDGITDIVGGLSAVPLGTPRLAVALGRGDGTFHPPQVVSATVQEPVGVGDLNSDGFIDVLALTPSTPPVSYILAGRGDGTFNPPIVTPVVLGAPTQVLDMNLDGLADLVVSAPPDFISVHPGHGDFTFGTPTMLRSAMMGEAMIAADLNGDALPDVASTTKNFERRIDLFLNNGNFTFGVTSIALPLDGGGITVRDMNGDGAVDLIVGLGAWSLTAGTWASGFVAVYLGDGSGTFGAPLTFPTNNGPVRVVAGDFNADGIADIATGNRSTVTQGLCDQAGILWDSVSILLGRGDGTLGPAASFALGDSEAFPDAWYKRSLHRLNTSDLNGDGRTDLISSPGAVILTGPPTENRPPVVDAGPDRFEPPTINDMIVGAATDPDFDWLSFEWRDEFGYVVGNAVQQCLGLTYSGSVEFTLTASDARGGVTSDSKVRTFGVGMLPLPEGFAAGNIGDVGAPGREAFSSGNLDVYGSGADIWGTSDEFRFVHRQMTGDFDVVARLSSLTNLDPWTKAGLMIRQSLTPQSRHAFVFGTPTTVNGVAFQRRAFDGGTTVHTWGPAVGPNVWLRLTREGDVITAYSRQTTADAWTAIDTQTLAGLSDPVYVGVAVTSHLDGTAARAIFSNFLVTPRPVAFSTTDVGTVGAAGSLVRDGDVYRVSGSGADIWDAQDAFHFAYLRMPGDGVMTVRVRDVNGPHEWSKAGLMIRQSLDANAVHHYLLASESKGLAYQRRLVPGGASLHTPLGAAMPVSYRIQRVGGAISLSYSTGTSSTWQFIASTPFPAGEALIGLAVTSHADGQLATGTFDDVWHSIPAPAGPWTSTDLGAVGVAGSHSLAGTTHMIAASGRDIWGTVDAFRYTYQALAGDGSIVARVASLNAVDAWTKAGVMIRASTDPSSAHAFVFVSRDYGVAFQRRTAAGGLTTHTYGPFAGAPMWVRLTRAGQVITAAASMDGATWQEVGSDTVAIGTGPVLVGLALTSHDNTALATATFDGVAVTP